MTAIDGFIFLGTIETFKPELYKPIAYPENHDFILFSSIVSPYLYLWDMKEKEIHEIEVESPPFVVDYSNINKLIAAYKMLKGN